MFRGSMVALVTPMTDDGAIDRDAMEKLIEFHIEQGTDAIVGVGTTGESATLDEREHCATIRMMIEMVAGRIPFIAGTGANSTREAIDLTRCAHEAGADACLLVTPYYNKPTQKGLYLHHRAVAEAVPVPQILYNVPGRTACDMLPDTVRQLSSVDNIIGIKEATGDLARAKEIRALCGPDFALYSGDDETGLAFMLDGGDGVISVTANVAPAAMARMCKAAMAGDREAAESINRELEALHRDLFVEANPIPVKWVLHEMGLIPEGIRLPMTWLSAEYHDMLRDAMARASVQ